MEGQGENDELYPIAVLIDELKEAPQLKIEIPANRYDMLCYEGISLMLNIFLHRQKAPQYTLKAPAASSPWPTCTFTPVSYS